MTTLIKILMSLLLIAVICGSALLVKLLMSHGSSAAFEFGVVLVVVTIQFSFFAICFIKRYTYVQRSEQ